MARFELGGAETSRRHMAAAGGGRGLKLVLLPLALLASTPAVSAEEPDSDYSTKETRAVMHRYAKCVVKRQPAKASEAIMTNVDNATLLQRYPMLLSSDCLNNAAGDGVSMRFGGDLYYYALADALVNREFAARTVGDLAGAPSPVHRGPGTPPAQVTASGKPVARKKYEAAVKTYERAAAYAYLSRYGECVARSNADGARTLLLTGPDTPQETAAFAALRSVFERCLEQGRTLRFGRVALRGSIAINFYRLAHAARVAATGMAG
jgi:hypothetical protein